MRQSIYDHIDKFSLVTLTDGYRLEDFTSHIKEYEIFLTQFSLKHQELNISRTYLLINKVNADVIAYMSLISDSIKLKQDERNTYFEEDASFPSYPAMKIAKLAVDKNYSEHYKYIGSLMIELARGIAEDINESMACRFITVDADVEHNEQVTDFYFKNGFVLNESYKRGRTISMRLNIYSDVEEEGSSLQTEEIS